MEREPQPAAVTNVALGDTFNTNTRSNGEHASKSPLAEAMEDELGTHAVSLVKTKALFTKQRKTHQTASEEAETLRDAMEASQNEWEDIERRKLDRA